MSGGGDGEGDGRFPDHRGKATWGGKLVPLAEFERAARAAGREGTAEQRRRAERAHNVELPDDTPVEGPFSRVVVFGGVYSNAQALDALLCRAADLDADAVYCLGDLGGFGPHPERIRARIEQGEVRVIQGNYEEALASGATDCNCGYTDPRDNHYARLSWEYTERNCSPELKRYLGSLPRRRRIRVGERELLAVHGSPRRINEFLFRSTTSVPYLEALLARERADGLLCTHTGLHWHRPLAGERHAVNVGVIGRPANDGGTHVWFSVLEARGAGLSVRFEPLVYDHEGLVREMRKERLPEPFVETIETGWWTTCLEILPAKERAASRY